MSERYHKERDLNKLMGNMKDDMNNMLKACFTMMGASELDITSFDAPDGTVALIRSATSMLKHCFEYMEAQNEVLSGIYDTVNEFKEQKKA